MPQFGKWLRSLLRRILRILLCFLAITVVGVSIAILLSGDSDYQETLPAQIINDITQLNPVRVDRVVQPTSESEIVAAILHSKGAISIGGGRYSQGGQTAYEDSLHLDMRQFSKVVRLDVEHKEVTVQAGITWRALQEVIDPHNLSVRIMQTYSNFTVGGSLSVNVHGRYIGEGPLVRSVKSIRLVLADGRLMEASPQHNADVFYGAIGGYGGLGVIVEATLSLADNKKIERRTTPMPVAAYARYFQSQVRDNTAIVFSNADLYPPDFVDVRDVSWHVTDKPLTIEDRLIPTDTNYWWQPRTAELVGSSDTGKWVRQHVIDPLYYQQDRVVWRNWEASYDVRELEPRSREQHTYGLREYFVPVTKFDEFVSKMREAFQAHQAEILNVSIRHALPDPGTLLSWAKQEVFAFVVYYRQGTTAEEKQKVADWSRTMIDNVLSVGGSYYLPYQLHETREQFQRAYPDADTFFALKARLDPENRFRNKLWQHLYPQPDNGVSIASVTQYQRGAEQSLLSIPEWYLVFNPVEYASHLRAGKSPSDFPFWDSIDQYWTLYDRVKKLTTSAYPENGEYLTMLRVIGVSTTAEYLWKGLYENSVGRLTAWAASGAPLAEEQLITQAHTAYSELIFDKAWYEFSFWSWVKKVWADTPLLGSDFIRRTERKLFFTAEFSFKALYAELIGFASHSAYAESSGLVHARAHCTGTCETPTSVKVIAQSQDQVLLALPRWGGFTPAVQQLTRAGFRFDDIAGNPHIAVSFLQARQFVSPLSKHHSLFCLPMLTEVARDRCYGWVPVDLLGDVLRTMDASGATLEHVYDF